MLELTKCLMSIVEEHEGRSNYSDHLLPGTCTCYCTEPCTRQVTLFPICYSSVSCEGCGMPQYLVHVHVTTNMYCLWANNCGTFNFAMFVVRDFSVKLKTTAIILHMYQNTCLFYFLMHCSLGIDSGN